MSRSLGTVGDLLVCLLLVLLVPSASDYVANALTPMLPDVDPDGVFLWVSVHHLVQLILTVLAAAALGFGLADLGFNLDNLDRSRSLLGSFLVVFVLVVLAGHVILYLTTPEPTFEHGLSARNVLGELGFKGLLSGTCEEPLFRGLVMMVLFRSWYGTSRMLGFEISRAGVLATILFVIAHIGFSIVPLQITWFAPVQLLQAAVLGTFYAVAFDRTRSLLVPIIAHNFANVFITGLGMIWASIA